MKHMGYDIEGGKAWPHTVDQAVARARQFDALIAQQGLYKGQVDAMHDANGDLQLFAYANGSHTSNAAFPENWYLHDANGVRLRSAPPWDMNFTMDPRLGIGPTATVNGISADSWSTWITKRIAQIEQTSGYDGIYIDELGTGSLTSRDEGIDEAIDPRTGTAWTKDDYMADIGVFLADITAKSSSPVWVNGLGSCYRFYGKLPWQNVPVAGRTSPLLAADAAAAELYLRGPGQGLDTYGGQPNHILDWWRTELAMTLEAGAKLITLTKTWYPDDKPHSETKAKEDRWHRYALTTALLGDPGLHFYFTYDRTTSVTPWHPYWTHVDRLGDPSGAHVIQGSGLYRRDFAGGFSLINPTNGAINWKMGIAATTLSGAKVAINANVSIPAHDGQVFVK